MRRRNAFALLAGLVISLSGANISPAQGQSGQTDMTVDAAARAQVIDAALKNLGDYYVLPEVAREMEKAIRERAWRKEYDRFTSAAEFAKALTTDLRAVSHDEHLSVNYSSKPVSPRTPQKEPTAEERQGLRNYGEDINFGFERVERLPGNVGYLRLNLFFPSEYGAETAVAAMNFVAYTDALIIDLRGNDGGDPNMVALLASYLFGAEPVQLSGLYQRKDNSTQQHWTLPYVPGKRYVGKDVYILTSKRTFSAGEAFTYDLKNLKRATLVGEVTGGGANPRDVYPLNEHFWMGLPVARAISPITNTNWEGVGVKPDVEVPAELALKTAHLDALNKLLASAGTDEGRKNRLRKVLETTQRELDDLKNKPR